MTTCLRYFAVRFGNHVEFRAATKPPTAIFSKITKKVITKEKRIIHINVSPFYKVSEDPKETKIVRKQTFYLGGKVLGVSKYGSFVVNAKDFGITSIPVDKMIEIPRDLKNKALKGRLL